MALSLVGRGAPLQGDQAVQIVAGPLLAVYEPGDGGRGSGRRGGRFFQVGDDVRERPIEIGRLPGRALEGNGLDRLPGAGDDGLGIGARRGALDDDAPGALVVDGEAVAQGRGGTISSKPRVFLFTKW